MLHNSSTLAHSDAAEEASTPSRKHATAQKVRQRIGTVMKWAIAQGYRNDNPAGDTLTAALPKRLAPVRHQRALLHSEVAGAVATVCGSTAWTGLKLVFEFLVLTAARSAEARLVPREEMDLDALVWTVPAARTKAGREHRVPLSSRAVEILDEAHRLGVDSTGVAHTELVFPSRRGKAIRDATLSGLLQQLGIGAVPHGFRSSFRDWASERTDHPREVVEAALAHVVRNQTEAAYARSDLFERRRRLMNEWMRYLRVRHPSGSEPSTGAKRHHAAIPRTPPPGEERSARELPALISGAKTRSCTNRSSPGRSVGKVGKAGVILLWLKGGIVL